jgi:hypothetical protein
LRSLEPTRHRDTARWEAVTARNVLNPIQPGDSDKRGLCAIYVHLASE